MTEFWVFHSASTIRALVISRPPPGISFFSLARESAAFRREARGEFAPGNVFRRVWPAIPRRFGLA